VNEGGESLAAIKNVWAIFLDVILRGPGIFSEKSLRLAQQSFTICQIPVARRFCKVSYF
jgi:hypothetical protein